MDLNSRDEQPKTSPSLILAFDAHCSTCRRIASAIEHEIGARLVVRPLSSPDIVKYRTEILGVDAPWTPTLIETSTKSAWTGFSMRLTLGRKLGVRQSWRVIKAIGQVVTNSDHSNEAQHSGRFSISRKDLLKASAIAAVGAAAIGLTGGFTSPGRKLAPASAGVAPIRSQVMEGGQLSTQMQSFLENSDVVNVIDDRTLGQLRSSKAIVKTPLAPTEGIWRLSDDGSTNLDGVNTVPGDCVVVRSVRHDLAGNNGMTTSVVVIPSLSRFVTLESFERSYNGVKSRAQAWNFTPKTGVLVCAQLVSTVGRRNSSIIMASSSRRPLRRRKIHAVGAILPRVAPTRRSQAYAKEELRTSVPRPPCRVQHVCRHAGPVHRSALHVSDPPVRSHILIAAADGNKRALAARRTDIPRKVRRSEIDDYQISIDNEPDHSNWTAGLRSSSRALDARSTCLEFR